MANEPVITIVGNLTADPELRYIASGIPVASFTVASTPRSKNTNTNQWEDGEPLFVQCSVWRNVAENVANSLSKGTRVIVQGRLTNETYEHNGQQRSSLKLDVDAIGPDLRYATAQVTRTTRDGGYQQNAGNVTYTAPQGGTTGDQWAHPTFNDAPPF